MNLNSTNFRFLSGAALLLCSAQTSIASERPNILVFVSDQLSWQALEVYGSEYAQTPTVDSLAHSGVAFANTYTSSPLSMPARAALWTGLYPHQTGVESNGRKWENPQVADDVPTMGSIFSENGYDCVHFGKRHDNGALRGFYCEPLKSIKIPDEFDEYPLTQDTYTDVYTIEKSVDYIESTTGKESPFFCVVDINNPHNICAYIGLFQGEHTNGECRGVLPLLPDNFVDPHEAQRPHPIQYMCCTHPRLEQTTEWTAENYRHYLAAYYYYANRMDRDVARVMEALQKSGKADNTLIVFLSDHGEGMAAKRMVTKQGSPYDQTTRVPLIFAGAGVKRAKSPISKPLVNVSIDLLPTLCEYANIDIKGDKPGESLMGWIEDSKDKLQRDYVCVEWTTEWGFTVSPYRMIRSTGYKYVKYLEDGAEELFDMKRDPLEMNNLVSEKKYSAILKQHQAYLAEHIEQHKDTFYSKKVHWDPRVGHHPVGYTNHTGEAAPNLK